MHWILFREVTEPGQSAPEPFPGRAGQDAVMIVHIDASWENKLWTVRDPVRGNSAAGQRLATAQRSLSERLARQPQLDAR